MRAIYKYPFRLRENHLELPVGAIFTHFGCQHGDLFAWFEVQLDAPQEMRTFEVYGTGREVAPYAKWMGTAQSGDLVWHLYEHEL